MQCIECGREHETCESGWVTVLASDPKHRVSFCPECIRLLLEHAAGEHDDE